MPDAAREPSDSLQVPFPLTNAGRRVDPTHRKPTAPPREGTSISPPSLDFGGVGLSSKLPSHAPPIPKITDPGVMGPPTGLPASRTRVINKEFERLLDKSPVPRSISRAYDSFQSPRLRQQSDKKRSLSRFTGDETSPSRLDGKASAGAVANAVKMTSAQTSTDASSSGNAIESTQDTAGTDHIDQVPPRQENPIPSSIDQPLSEGELSAQPVEFVPLPSPTVLQTPEQQAESPKRTEAPVDGEAEKTTVEDSTTTVPSDLPSSLSSLGTRRELHKRKRPKSLAGSTEVSKRVQRVAESQLRSKSSGVRSKLPENRKAEPARTDMPKDKNRPPKNSVPRIFPQVPAPKPNDAPVISTAESAPRNTAKPVKKAILRDKDKPTRSPATFAVPKTPVCSDLVTGYADIDKFKQKPSPAISKMLGLDIPQSILESTGSSWDPQSGRRHSRRSTVCGVAGSPPSAQSAQPTSTSKDKSKKHPSSAPAKRTRTQSITPAKEVPNSGPRRKSSRVSKVVGGNRQSEAKAEAGIKIKRRAIEKTPISKAPQALSARSAERARARAKAKELKNKKQGPAPVVPVEKDPYDFSDEE